MSASKDNRGQWCIDKAELLRVYPDSDNQRGKVDSSTQPDNHGLQSELDTLKQERERERRQLEQTVTDLRQRLDKSEDERRRTAEQLTNLLTHNKEQDQPLQKTTGRFARAWAALVGKQ